MPTMSTEYLVDYYKRKRRKLLKILGGECVCCGSKKKLEFDHINGRSWEVTDIGSHRRICRYFKEAKKGKIQILCHECNVSKGDGKRCTLDHEGE